MRLLLTGLLLTAFFALNAQYHPFTIPGRQWNEQLTSFMPGGQWVNNYQIGDSLNHNGRNLPMVLSVDSMGNTQDTLLVISENSISKTITFINYNWQEFSFLYGDSITLNLGMSQGDSSVYSCLGDTVFYVLDSTSLFTDQVGEVRNRYHFHTSANGSISGQPEYFSWTEGLGNIDRWYSSFVYFFPVYHCMTDYPLLKIICISDQDGTQLYQHPDFNTCQPLNTSYEKVEELKLYPNPAHDLLRIENTANITAVEILDMTGQIQRSWSFSGGDPVLEINLDGLTPGVYIVKSTRGTSVSVRKIIVQ